MKQHCQTLSTLIPLKDVFDSAHIYKTIYVFWGWDT